MSINLTIFYVIADILILFGIKGKLYMLRENFINNKQILDILDTIIEVVDTRSKNSYIVTHNLFYKKYTYNQYE